MKDLIQEQIQLPVSYSATPEAESVKLALLSMANEVRSVVSANDQAIAINAGKNIRSHVKEVEAMRVELTAPLLAAQRQLKALSDAHCEPLMEELRRVSSLVTQFQMQENERVERERQAQVRAYELAEKARVEAEQAAAKAAERINTDRQLDKAIAKEQELAMAASKVQEVLAAPMPFKAKASGSTLRQMLRFEVMDIKAVYAARPELCTLEIKKSAVQATCVPEVPVPGLKMWYENVTSIRG